MFDETNVPPLRIVHCFREPTGGLFRHVCDLARRQAANGHQVAIICDATTGGAREDGELEQIRPTLALGLHRIAMRRQIGIGDLGAALMAYRTIKKLQPDILHGHGAKGGVYGRLSGSALRVFRSRVARIYSPHGGSLHFDTRTRHGGAVFLIEKLLAPLTEAILFVSNHEKRIYEEKVGRPYDLHAVIYNGLSDEEFSPAGTNADASDFLFIGAMRELKGPDLLIRAIANIRNKQGQALTATIVGDGADKPEFVALANELGITKQIRFLPGMAAREALPLGRIMVIPSRAEALPYIVLEALAAGKSVIASNIGGIAEIFGSDSPALVEPDIGALAEKLLAVAIDEGTFRSSMPDSSRLHERFNLQTMAHSIEIVYREALS
ncbi:glycosyltransferase [Falsochrobactrum sp. TDYN1]|uniref:Glycosyltransferase n=1 Tax=Falsochrobactrum tianjinense TaxID=2706015 RepID=A0A949PMV7_9HYPH|nr:glycosyltransferase [Falsochrobactrum sp. TDYN1]MBV2142796.1 glycosyltransferase [Falsochrobactrum sp. TDYN1]